MIRQDERKKGKKIYLEVVTGKMHWAGTKASRLCNLVPDWQDLGKNLGLNSDWVGGGLNSVKLYPNYSGASL